MMKKWLESYAYLINKDKQNDIWTTMALPNWPMGTKYTFYYLKPISYLMSKERECEIHLSAHVEQVEMASPATQVEMASPATQVEMASPATQVEMASPATQVEMASPATQVEMASQETIVHEQSNNDATQNKKDETNSNDLIDELPELVQRPVPDGNNYIIVPYDNNSDYSSDSEGICTLTTYINTTADMNMIDASFKLKGRRVVNETLQIKPTETNNESQTSVQQPPNQSQLSQHDAKNNDSFNSRSPLVLFPPILILLSHNMFAIVQGTLILNTKKTA